MLQLIRFVGMRFTMAIFTLLMVTFIVFSLMELSPVQYNERCRQFFNFMQITIPLDKPFFIRWVDWVKDVFCAWRFWLFLHLADKDKYIAGNKILDFAWALPVVVAVGIPHCPTVRYLLSHRQQSRP